MNEAVATPEKFIRTSLMRLEGVQMMEVVGSQVSNNHYASKGAFIDLSQGTNLILISSTFEQMSAATGGVLSISVDSKALIDDCEFISNSALSQGVLSVNVQSEVSIYRSKFQSNQALTNGVLKVQGDSDILIEGCQFWDNQAEYKNSIGSLFQIKSFAKIVASRFYQNRAHINAFNSNQLGKLMDFIAIPAPITIEDCQFNDNAAFIGTPNLYFFDVGNVSILNSEFSNEQYTTTHSSTQVKGNFIQIISSATMKISKCTFTNGNALVGGAIFIQGEAKLSIENTKFEDNFASKQGGALFVDSVLELSITKRCIFNDNQGKVFGGDAIYVQNSEAGTVTLSNIEFQTRVVTSNFVHIEDVKIVRVSQVVAQHVLKYSSMAYKIGGFYLKNVEAIIIEQSEFINLYGAYNQGGGALVVEYTDDLQTTPVEIRDCIIRDSISSTKGAGLAVINTRMMNITRTNITNNNAAKSGGGLLFSCNTSLSQTYPCTLNIQDSSFTSNHAGQEGGAVKWNFYEPLMTNVVFVNNSAEIYGDDIGSVSKQLIRIMKDMIGAKKLPNSGALFNSLKFNQVLDTIQSGGNDSFYFGLVDKYGSFVRTDNTSSIVIQQVQNYINFNRTIKNSSDFFTTVIESDTQVTAVNGFFSIENLILVSTPNSKQSNYLPFNLYLAIKFITDGVDINVPDNRLDTVENLTALSINLQIISCQPGQQLQSNGKCKKCEQGTYLLTPPTDVLNCKDCQSEVSVCMGGTEIFPRPGYWRSSNTSDNFMKCLNPISCLGGVSNPEANEECFEGYRGILCATCKRGYSLSESSYKCQKCPSASANSFLLLIFAISIIFFITILVRSNLKNASKEKNQLPVFLRILLNHLQILSLISSFDFNWPNQILEFYKNLSLVSEAQSQLISIDCFIDYNSQYDETHKSFYVKSIVLAVLPAFMVLVSLGVWISLDCVKSLGLKQEPHVKQSSESPRYHTSPNHSEVRQKDEQIDPQTVEMRQEKSGLKGNMISTMIVILFLIHPSITKQMFNLFNCKQIEGTQRLYNDLSVVCYHGQHGTIAIGVAMPCIVIYSLGIPLVGFWVVWRNRGRLQTTGIRQKYGFLYNGYKGGASSYWEILIIYRKVIIIFISVFLVQNGKLVQALVTLMFLLLMLSLVYTLKPYNQEYLNQLESLSLLSSAISVYFCIFFISDSLDPSQLKYDDSSANTMMFLLIIFFQVYFLSYWAYCFFKEFQSTIRQRHPHLYFLVFKCCRQREFQIEKDLEEYQAKVVAPLASKIDSMKDYLVEKVGLYRQGHIPVEDRELREFVIKFTQFQQSVESSQKYQADKRKFHNSEMVLFQAKSDGLSIKDIESFVDYSIAEPSFSKDITASCLIDNDQKLLAKQETIRQRSLVFTKGRSKQSPVLKKKETIKKTNRFSKDRTIAVSGIMSESAVSIDLVRSKGAKDQDFHSNELFEEEWDLKEVSQSNLLINEMFGQVKDADTQKSNFQDLKQLMGSTVSASKGESLSIQRRKTSHFSKKQDRTSPVDLQLTARKALRSQKSSLFQKSKQLGDMAFTKGHIIDLELTQEDMSDEEDRNKRVDDELCLQVIEEEDANRQL